MARAQPLAFALASAFVGLSAAVLAAAAPPVAVFGLPLGGSFPAGLATCEQSGDAPASGCWTVKGRRAPNGEWGGVVTLPPAKVPKWAAYSPLNILIDPDGNLAKIQLSMEDAKFDEIERSVALRWGAPKFKSRPLDDLRYSSWALPELDINIINGSRGCCLVHFVSRAQADKEAEYRRTSRIEHPDSP